jgi:hypothetical protein
MKIEPEAGLRAVLRALALGPSVQLALFPPASCPSHSVKGHWPCLYREDDHLESITANWPDLDLIALTRVRLVDF